MRWGQSFWIAGNATWPFARLRADRDGISIVLRVFGVSRREFRFSRADLVAVRKKRGIFPFNTGVEFEHTRPDYPPYILFWTLRYRRLRRELNRLGFDVEEM